MTRIDLSINTLHTFLPCCFEDSPSWFSSSLILVLGCLLDSAKASGTAGTDETDLTTGWAFLGNGGRHTNVLMVTSSVWMLHWILGHTTNLRPAVALDGVLVVGASGLQQRLVGTSTTGDDSDLGTHVGRDGLLTTGWQAETGGSLVFVVGHDDGEGAGATGKGTAISELGLDVAHDGALRDLVQWKDVANGQGGLLSAVDELSAVHAFRAQEELVVALVSVGVQELDLGDWSATTRVVQDLLDDSADVSLLFGIVQSSQLHGSLAGARVGLEHAGLTLTLCLLIEHNNNKHHPKNAIISLLIRTTEGGCIIHGMVVSIELIVSIHDITNTPK